MLNELLHDPRLWTGVSLVIFFILFGRKLWAGIASVLDNHIQNIRDDLDEAARLRQEAEKILEEASVQKTRAQAEASKLIEQSEEEARNICKRAEANALAEAKLQEEIAKKQIDALQQKAIANFKDEALKVAIASVEEFLSKELDSASALNKKVMARTHKELSDLLKTGS